MTETPTFAAATAPAPGAVGLIEVTGPGASAVVERLTGRRPDERCRMADLGGVDEGLVAALREDWCELMPHGGPRVMQRLAEALIDAGARPATERPATRRYPEASTELEAEMLATLAEAASPAAIDVLLEQPDRWRAALAGPALPVDRVLRVSDRLDRLVRPPTVALLGGANVGKSTLTNWVTGRATSITADLPGTTRDWLGGLVELPTSVGEVAVRWVDTPGRRPADGIEQRAVELSEQVVREADVLVAVRDDETGWPEGRETPRTPDLRVWNKADRGLPANVSAPATDVLPVSAWRGDGVDALAEAIAATLGLRSMAEGVPWAFTSALRQRLVRGDRASLAAACGV